MYWFTSDLHFDHTNIMKHCNRPFKNVQDMNVHLVHHFNKVVGRGDVVVIAGDITLHTNTELVWDRWMSKLNGNLIILKGNHDHWIRKEKRYLYHKRINKIHVAVGHYPMRTWQNSIHGSLNLHGHSHGTLRPFKNQLDIGVDSAKIWLGEYRPFSFDEVCGAIETTNRRLYGRSNPLRHLLRLFKK
jgi:calcineurin-like phosphoesterase family protein